MNLAYIKTAEQGQNRKKTETSKAIGEQDPQTGTETPPTIKEHI